MEKVHTTITLDKDLQEKAAKQNINLSGTLNEFLRKYLEPKKSDLPQEVLVVLCSRCKKQIKEGFVYRERNLVLCQECQDSFDMLRCPHDKRGEHMHIKWTETQNQDLVQDFKKVQEVKET